jgi:outer membrane lipoprotein SlyB
MARLVSRAKGRKMKSPRTLSLVLFFTVGLGGCVAHTTTETMYQAPQPEWARPGFVQWIREVVDRQDGNPAGGAVAGAIIGGLLFGHDAPSTIIGAAGGAAVGAAVSQGHSEQRRYEVAVRFDDGGFQTFVYPNGSPFRPGEPVVLTPRGLYRR